jgi:hypothetical protein
MPPKPNRKGPAPKFCPTCMIERRHAKDRESHNRAYAEGRTKGQRLRASAPRPVSTCPVCGGTVPTKPSSSRGVRVYCTPGCYREARRRKDAEQKRAWRAAHPEKARAIERRRSSTPRRKAYEQARGLRRSFNLSRDEYEAMLVRQGGKCAICGRSDSGRAGARFYVDHDHTTGKIRELLCISCNAGIGLLGDSPQRILAAAEYIEGYAPRSTP